MSRFGTKCGPIQKYWTALCTFDCSAMAKKRRELQRHSLPIAATESGASWLAERAPMMPCGLCICRATWCQPCAAAGRTAKTPCPSIRHDKKDIVGERGL